MYICLLVCVIIYSVFGVMYIKNLSYELKIYLNYYVSENLYLNRILFRLSILKGTI